MSPADGAARPPASVHVRAPQIRTDPAFADRIPPAAVAGRTVIVCRGMAIPAAADAVPEYGWISRPRQAPEADMGAEPDANCGAPGENGRVCPRFGSRTLAPSGRRRYSRGEGLRSQETGEVQRVNRNGFRQSLRCVCVTLALVIWAGRGVAGLTIGYSTFLDLARPTPAAAAAAWIPHAGSPPAQAITVDGCPALRLQCQLDNPAIARASWDVAVALDLRLVRGLRLTFRCADPAAVNAFWIYLKSGDGWYAGEVRSRNADVVQVAFDDGDVEMVSLSRVRLRAQP